VDKKTKWKARSQKARKGQLTLAQNPLRSRGPKEKNVLGCTDGGQKRKLARASEEKQRDEGHLLCGARGRACSSVFRGRPQGDPDFI